MGKYLLLLGFLVLAFPAQAAMKIDVSESNIQVTTGFNGTSITVFGVQEGEGDVVIVVEGPVKDYIVRKKGRTLGLWTNVDSRDFDNVPGYYEVAASTALPLIATPELLGQYHIGVENLPIFDKRLSNSVRTLAFRDAFIESQRAKHHYVLDTRELTYVSPNSLFKARFTLPADVPSGVYSVYAFLFANGQLMQSDQTKFIVKPVGTSAEMRHFAQESGFFYGLTAIMMAVFAGWLATVLLKRD